MIMKTWNDYKEHVRTVDPEIGKELFFATSRYFSGAWRRSNEWWSQKP